MFVGLEFLLQSDSRVRGSFPALWSCHILSLYPASLGVAVKRNYCLMALIAVTSGVKRRGSSVGCGDSD